jgi:hypothetical protein
MARLRRGWAAHIGPGNNLVMADFILSGRMRNLGEEEGFVD